MRLLQVVGHPVPGPGLVGSRYRLFTPQAEGAGGAEIGAFPAVGKAHDRHRQSARVADFQMGPVLHLHRIARARTVARVGHRPHLLAVGRRPAQQVIGVAVGQVPFAGAVFGDDGHARIAQAAGRVGHRVIERIHPARRRHLAAAQGVVGVAQGGNAVGGRSVGVGVLAVGAGRNRQHRLAQGAAVAGGYGQVDRPCQTAPGIDRDGDGTAGRRMAWAVVEKRGLCDAGRQLHHARDGGLQRLVLVPAGHMVQRGVVHFPVVAAHPALHLAAGLEGVRHRAPASLFPADIVDRHTDFGQRQPDALGLGPFGGDLHAVQAGVQTDRHIAKTDRDVAGRLLVEVKALPVVDGVHVVVHFIDQVVVGRQGPGRIQGNQAHRAAPLVAVEVDRTGGIEGADGSDGRLGELGPDQQVFIGAHYRLVIPGHDPAVSRHVIGFVHQAITAKAGMVLPFQRRPGPEIGEVGHRERGTRRQCEEARSHLRGVAGVGPQQLIGRHRQANDRAIGLEFEVLVAAVVVQVDDAPAAHCRMRVEHAGDVGRVDGMKLARLANGRPGRRVGRRVVQHGLQQLPLDRQTVLPVAGAGQVSHIGGARHGEVHVGHGTGAKTQTRQGPFHS